MESSSIVIAIFFEPGLGPPYLKIVLSNMSRKYLSISFEVAFTRLISASKSPQAPSQKNCVVIVPWYYIMASMITFGNLAMEARTTPSHMWLLTIREPKYGVCLSWGFM
jgi:hypothetical protein